MGNGYEIGADSASVYDFVGYAFVSEAEAPLRFMEGGVDDWIFYDNLFHIRAMDIVAGPY